MSKVALVTGASSGIGLETALLLVEKGFIVYGAARRTNLIKPLEDKGGKALFLDLNDDDSIVACVDTVLKNEGRLDVLVNNSGYGLGGSLEAVPLEEAKKQFQVNVFGLARITQLVLPTMRKQRSGRIINISSMAGRFSTPFSCWYHASKYSVEALSDSLRMELKPFGIKVSIIEPGMIQTNWGAIHAQNIRKYTGDDDYAKFADKVAIWYEKHYLTKGKIAKPTVISRAILRAACAKNPKTRYKVGTGSKLNIFVASHVGNRLLDFITLKALGI